MYGDFYATPPAVSVQTVLENSDNHPIPFPIDTARLKQLLKVSMVYAGDLTARGFFYKLQYACSSPSLAWVVGLEKVSIGRKF